MKYVWALKQKQEDGYWMRTQNWLCDMRNYNSLQWDWRKPARAQFATAAEARTWLDDMTTAGRWNSESYDWSRTVLVRILTHDESKRRATALELRRLAAACRNETRLYYCIGRDDWFAARLETRASELWPADAKDQSGG